MVDLVYGPVWTRVFADWSTRDWLSQILTVQNFDQFPSIVNFYDRFDDSFLTGHLHYVEFCLQRAGIDYRVHERFTFLDEPQSPSPDILATPHHPDFRLKPFQVLTTRKMVFGIRGGVQLATGAGKTASYIASLKFLEQIYGRPVPSLTLVNVTNLAQQMNARMRNAGLNSEVLSGGKWGSAHHVVAVVNGVYDRLSRGDASIQGMLSTREVLCIDEGHHGQAEMLYNVSLACPAHFRWCLSATLYASKVNPYMHSGDMRILGLTGPTLAIIPAKFLWEHGFVAEPQIVFIPMPWPNSWHRRSLPWRGDGEEGVEWELIVDNEYRNEYLRRLIYWTLVKEPDAKFVILIQRLEHGRILQRMLHRVGIRSVCCYGAGKTIVMDRFSDQKEEFNKEGEVLAEFADGRLKVLIGSQKFDEGQSFPLFTDLILAQAGKGGEANRRVYQRVGRGLHSGVRVRVWEFLDENHHMTKRQSDERLNALIREEYPVRIETPPECHWTIPGL